MPFYDYQYLDTGEIVEIEHSMNTKITEHNGREVKRVFSAVPTHYHCDGFYETDYKKKTFVEKK